MKRRGFLAQAFALTVAAQSFMLPGSMAAAAEADAGKGSRVCNILVYGDSNSFGWVTSPKDAAGRVVVSRLAAGETWPERMALLLGDDFRVTVDALGGRTSDLDEPRGSGSGAIPAESFNGLATLPAALSSHMPLDLVIVMLGTNDLKTAHDRTAYDVALALGRITSTIRKGRWQSKTAYAAPRVLVVSPALLDDGKRFYGDFFAGALQKSKALAAAVEPVVRAAGAEFFDAARVVGVADQVDGVHLTAEQHRLLGEAVARRVKPMFEKKP